MHACMLHAVDQCHTCRSIHFDPCVQVHAHVTDVSPISPHVRTHQASACHGHMSAPSLHMYVRIRCMPWTHVSPIFPHIHTHQAPVHAMDTCQPHLSTCTYASGPSACHGHMSAPSLHMYVRIRCMPWTHVSPISPHVRTHQVHACHGHSQPHLSMHMRTCTYASGACYVTDASPTAHARTCMLWTDVHTQETYPCIWSYSPATSLIGCDHIVVHLKIILLCP